MRHVVQFSTGLASWGSAVRVKERFGAESMVLLMADVNMEDEDNYRFAREASEQLGVTITRVADGRTPWEVFFDEGMMGSSRVDLCSRILKRKLLDKWRKENTTAEDSVVYVGMMWDEGDRLEGVRRRLAPWTVEAPMMDKPYLTKHDLETTTRKLGIEPPRLYGMGMPHANCGGFCVKAGQAQFATLLRVMPERYRFHEAQEERFRALHGDVSIMTDRRGGEKKPLSMKAFREGIEAGGTCDMFEWGGCGCGV